MAKIKGLSALTGECMCLQNIADQKKRAEELAESASAESQRPTKASGMAAPVVPEPVKAGDKRRNRWDQSISSEYAPTPPHNLHYPRLTNVSILAFVSINPIYKFISLKAPRHVLFQGSTSP